METLEFLNAAQVRQYLNISEPTLYRLMRQTGEGAFPQPFRMTGIANRWRKEELDRWLEGRRRKAA